MPDCPACGAAHDVGAVFTAEQCPACETALADLHAIAAEGRDR